MKLWAGRFKKGSHALLEAYNASIGFDYRLAAFDILGSMAHVKMLAHCGFIQAEEAEEILKGLAIIKANDEAGACDYQIADEDIHMNIERMLHEIIGPVAGKLHSGRSRNDQVALDVHLYLRHHLILIVQQLHVFLQTLKQLAKDHIDTIIPGYTHLQRAEPVRLGHHFLAWFQMLARDVERLMDSFKRVNCCPLGAGALAGSGIAVDRELVAELLKFERLYENSLDAVSDRDFVIEFLANAATLMMHLSRISEELVLWNTQEFSFIQFDDMFCTGSSMMPQKKNPDICELARGKTGRVYGALLGLLTMLKGLPLAYNKDMQEDKEGLFDTIDTLEMTLDLFPHMLESMQVNSERTKAVTEQDFSNTTSLANYLLKKDIPFRQAHEITGKMVSYCLEKGCYLQDLDLDKFQSFHKSFEQDVYEVLDSVYVIESHCARGGTAKASVEKQLLLAKETLSDIEIWLKDKKECINLSL